MNVEEMKKRADAALVRCYACGGRATCVGAYEGQKVTEYCCDDCCGHGNEDGHCSPLEDVNAEPLAADVLTLLAERERLAEEHDGIMNAPSVNGSPQLVAGKVLRFEFRRPEHGPIEVATRMFFAWSERAARAAAESCGEDVTLVLDAPSAVRAGYGAKERLDALLAERAARIEWLEEALATACQMTEPPTPEQNAALLEAEAEIEKMRPLLAALRSVDERELPEHVAAALRALDTPATQPAADPHVSSR